MTGLRRKNGVTQEFETKFLWKTLNYRQSLFLLIINKYLVSQVKVLFNRNICLNMNLCLESVSRKIFINILVQVKKENTGLSQSQIEVKINVVGEDWN